MSVASGSMIRSAILFMSAKRLRAGECLRAGHPIIKAEEAGSVLSLLLSAPQRSRSGMNAMD